MPTLALVSELTSATKRNGILHTSRCAPGPLRPPCSSSARCGCRTYPRTQRGNQSPRQQWVGYRGRGKGSIISP